MEFLQNVKRRFLPFLPLLPLFAASGVVPLIVYLKVVPVAPPYRPFWPTALVFDFFSFYKAQILILCAGMLLLTGLVLAWKGTFPRKLHMLYVPLMIYTVGMLASSIKSAHPFIVLGGFFDRDEGVWVLLSYIILFLSSYLLVSKPRQAWWVLWAWMGGLVLIGLVGLFQYFGLDPFQTTAGLRLILPENARIIASQLNFAFPRASIYSTLANPNNAAAMFSLAFPFAAAVFVLSPSRRRRVVFGGLAGLFGVVLLGTHGRAAWMVVLLALIGLAVYAVRSHVPGAWKRLALVGVMLIAGYGLLNFASRGRLAEQGAQPLADVGSVVENGLGSLEGGASPPSADGGGALVDSLLRDYGHLFSGRVYIWIRSLQMAPSTLLLGHGPDTFALYFPNGDPDKTYYGQLDVFIDKPHNFYLQTWLNLGGLAALALAAMLVLHARQTLRLLRQADEINELTGLAAGLFLGWLAYLLAALFYDSTVSTAPAFWIVFGLGAAVNQMLGEAKVVQQGS